MPRNQASGGPAFADALNNLMKQSGLRQSEVARQLDVWDSLVNRWRKGGGISLPYVRKLADLFKVDRGQLEILAGYGASPLPTASDLPSDPMMELERARWHKWFEHLRLTVPRSMWEAYTTACEAMAGAMVEQYARFEGDPRQPASPSLAGAAADAIDQQPDRPAADAADDGQPTTGKSRPTARRQAQSRSARSPRAPKLRARSTPQLANFL